MSGSGEEPKGDTKDSITELDEQVSRADFLKKLIAGGVVSVAAISGLGGLQKVFGEKDSFSQTSEKGDNTDDIASLIQQVNRLRGELGELQSQFANVISGKLKVPEMVIDKLTSFETIHYKLSVPETGFIKINGDSTFYKLSVPETGFIKINGDSTFYKLSVPENGFLKMAGDASFVKLDATEIVAKKIVAGTITTETPTTVG